eukprot:351585-Chlamydomonas_euryale.AAC.6
MHNTYAIRPACNAGQLRHNHRDAFKRGGQEDAARGMPWQHAHTCARSRTQTPHCNVPACGWRGFASRNPHVC